MNWAMMGNIMKYLAICIGFGLTFQVMTASAEDLSYSVNISADVPKTCSFTSPVPTNTTENGFSDTSANSSNFTVNIDAATLTAKATNGVIKFANSFCNYNAYVTLSRDGLITDTDPTGDFKNKIEYKATAGWVGGIVQLLLDVTDVDPKTEILPPTSGDFEIGIIVAGSEKLVDGHYHDTLRLTVSQNL